MATKKKMLQAAAGSAGGGGPTVIEDVFSTYLYTGNGSTQTITNGIDLAGEGGLVWTKNRDNAFNHFLYDTERGVNNYLISDLTIDQQTVANSLTAFNSDGFTLGSNDYGNITSGAKAVSWTFRKAPRFFDVVTYTGDGTIGRALPHNLGCEVGTIIIKNTGLTSSWAVYHRNLNGGVNPENYRLQLNTTDATILNAGGSIYTAPTDSEFTVSGGIFNADGYTYVAYLYAHDPLGPSEDGSDGLISCGSYTGNGSADGPEIDLGWEPQWVMIKQSSTGGTDWYMHDNMRGIATGGNDARLKANLSEAEFNGANYIDLKSTGFKLGSGNAVNNNGETHIYIAIRRGPMRVPESGTEVFDVFTGSDAGGAFLTTGFTVDSYLGAKRSGSSFNTFLSSRLTSGKGLVTSSTSAEFNAPTGTWDYNEGIVPNLFASADTLYYNFRRAPNFFDVVAYTGTGINGLTLNHNLDAVPEMILVRHRNVSYTPTPWFVYHSALGNTKYLHLNTTAAEATSQFAWNNTSPTDINFTVGAFDGVNGSSGFNYIAYLFATLAGVSKVGSYTGNGTTLNIDCGFTTGARFVLIKGSSFTHDWHVFDTARGIVAGNDPFLELNTTNAENASYDAVDPLSSGFTVNQTAVANLNADGASYIFYAIA